MKTHSIQQTGKGWKSLKIVAILAAAVAGCLAIDGQSNAAAAVLGAALGAWILSRLGAWWCHA